jgi:sulfate permease, SulP family
LSLPRPAITRPAWLSPRVFRTEALSGLVVAIALIPEATSFSILAGALQIAMAFLGVARLMRFVPRSVMVGFVNALAILILLAQVPYVVNVPWIVYPMVVIGVVIMLVLPRFTRAVPAPLVAVILLTAAVVVFGWNVPNVGDQGELPGGLPILGIPAVPFTLETLAIIFPFAIAMALVGLMESLMTAKLVDDITDTHSNKTRESWGQGVANVVTGFFGGMGGCAMIGQTMINVKVNGARTRLSTFLAGVFLLVLVVVLGDIVAVIPMAALVAVMIIVSYSTFDWHSLKSLPHMPKSETIVMVVTVVATVVTHNLAIGVIVGVVTATVLFARRVAHLVTMSRQVSEDGSHVLYQVHGELFFASSNDLVYQFHYSEDPPWIVIDLSHAHLWDASTIATLDAIVFKYENRGKSVDVVGLNDYSVALRARLDGRLQAGH